MLPLIGQYEALDAARQKQFDDAYAQATAQGFNASAELTQSIDMEANAITQNLHLKQRELVRYGYGIDGKYDPFKAKTIEQRRIEQEAKRQAAYAQQGSQGGTTPSAPFNQGGDGYFNGLEVFNEQQGLIMPITKEEIKRQGAANVNEGVGYGRGRLHAGQDIGLDLGTPIVAQMSGKVSRIWSESDGGAGTSGNAVEITYPDGSAHTFMHLKERPNLAVGQSVRAGQVVAKAGNTGLPGGNANVGNVHLHWEVRYGDKLSTPQEWSTKYRQSQQNRPSQPRATGPGSSITAPVRGAQGVPIKGGMLVPNGKGGASQVPYNRPQQTVAQVKQQYDVNSPSRVDKSRAGQVLLQRTGQKGSNGLENLVVTVFDKNGDTAGEYLVNSGSPAMQGTFGPANTTTAGSNSPLEFGMYNIGQGVDATDVPGMHSQFIPIEPGFDTQRSLLGIHFDGDRSVKPGSAGGIVFTTKSSFDAFHTKLKEHGNHKLEFTERIRDTGQQKQRASVPARVVETNGRVLYGPGGTRFQRDAQGGMVALPSPVSGGYSNANPLRALTNSNRATDYNINDLSNDHGFAPLKRNPSAARAVNEVAKSFGVPGEWLAEVISIETGNTFDPNKKEYGGSGATGLIQFYPDNDGGSTKTINGRVYNLSDIGRMSMEQQLRGPVKDYITEAMRSNNMKRVPTIQDMYALIWAYGPASKARTMRDQRGPSGTEILNRLGKFSGRRYSSVQPSPNTNIAQADNYTSERSSKLIKRVDRSYHASCTTCNQRVNTSLFVPHERVSLNSGMETFNIA
jgi:murein DD-endopeptidase MepM/ murein hydrolase activator NlpD